MSYPIPEDYADLHYNLTHPDRHSTGTVFADVMVEAIERIARLEADKKALLDTLNWIGTTRASAWDYVEAARQTIKEMNSAAIEQARKP